MVTKYHCKSSTCYYQVWLDIIFIYFFISARAIMAFSASIVVHYAPPKVASVLPSAIIRSLFS